MDDLTRYSRFLRERGVDLVGRDEEGIASAVEAYRAAVAESPRAYTVTDTHHEIREEGDDHWRRLHVSDVLPAAEDDERWQGYVTDARKLVDRLSKDYTPLGIEILLAALWHVLRVEDYRGKHSAKHSAKRART